MAKRCSHCNSDNHNLRTCPNRGVRLFGVRLTDGSIQKSASTGNLAIFARSASASGSSRACPQDPPIADEGGSGYVSEGFNGGSASRERKKGVPWTEQEHKMFLLGLKKLGKGDWRGISRNFVISRTPTQVASHAQKYFIRHSANNRRKRRVSLFDIVADEPATANNAHLSSDHSEHEAQQAPDVQSDSTKDQDYCTPIPPATIKYSYPPPVYPLFLPLPNEASSAEAEGSCAPVYPAFFFPPDVPFSIPCWTGCTAPTTALPSHEIVKPTAVHSKSPIDAGELFSMSKLTLGPLQQLVGSSERRSAFHARETAAGSRLDSGSSPIHAV